MPVHKLSLIMVSNVQENAFFMHDFSKISLPWERENPLPHPPPAQSRRSLALAPVDKSWLHHRHWHS